MKNYIILLALLVSWQSWAQAQLLAPHQEAFDQIIPLLGKELGKEELKLLRKNLQSSSVKKGYSGKKLLDGYVDRQKYIRLVAEAGGTLEYLSFTVENYGKKQQKKWPDLFPAFQGKTLEELGEYAEQQGWLEQAVHVEKHKKLYARLPNSEVVFSLEYAEGMSPLTLSVEDSYQQTHKRYYKELKKDKAVCDKALATAPSIYQAPSVAKGGTCLEGCDQPNQVQTWHYGNAIFRGIVEDGLPSISEEHHYGQLFVFDKEQCRAKLEDIKEYQYWSGDFVKGQVTGKHSYAQNYTGKDARKNEHGRRQIGVLYYEKGQLQKTTSFYFTSDWEPAHKKDAAYHYEGDFKNGQPIGNGLLRNLETELYYDFKYKNGRPDLSQPVKVLYSNRETYWLGRLDDKWEPKGLGEMRYTHKKTSFPFKWIIKGNFISKNELAKNSPVTLLDEQSGLLWLGQAAYCKLYSTVGMDIKGDFRIFQGLDTTAYSQGSFITGKLKDKRPKGSSVDVWFPMPVGKHEAYKLVDGKYVLNNTQVYEKGFPMQLGHVYKYDSYERYSKTAPSDYYKSAEPSTQEAFKKELLVQLKKKYPKAHIYRYIDHISIPGNGGVGTTKVSIYNFSTKEDVEVGLRVKGKSEVIAARKLHAASPLEGSDGLTHEVQNSTFGHWMQLNRKPYVEDIYIVIHK